MGNINLYHNITLTNQTVQKRNQIKHGMDNFTSFSWDGFDAFDNFGAFIINESKGSLKFYNGPGFSNEYTKPQFDNAGGSLEGVSFNKQSISFSVGVYWISIEHYRLFIEWLNPLKISYLIFGHDRRYRYNVKLSKIVDSTRWVVGKENIDGQEKDMYYTELALTFEVQGDSCARGVNPYEFGATLIPKWYNSSSVWEYNGGVFNSQGGNVQQTNFTVYPGQIFTFNTPASKTRFVLEYNYTDKSTQEVTSSYINGDINHEAATYFKVPSLTSTSHTINQKIILQKAINTKDKNFDWCCMSDKINNKIQIKQMSKRLIQKDGQLVFEESSEKYYYYAFKIQAYDTFFIHSPSNAPRYFIASSFDESKMSDNSLINDIISYDTSSSDWVTISLVKDQWLLLQIPEFFQTETEKYQYVKNTSLLDTFIFGTSLGQIHGWCFNEGANNTTIYYDLNNKRCTAKSLTSVFYYDYPVKAGECYEIDETATTKNDFPCYIVLDDDKELLAKDEKIPVGYLKNGELKGKRRIKITEDGYIRLQICKSSNIDTSSSKPWTFPLILRKSNVSLGWQIDADRCEYDTGTTNTEGSTTLSFSTQLNKDFDFYPSDMATPFEINIPLSICQEDHSINQQYSLALWIEKRANNGDLQDSVSLADISLFNLTHSSTSDLFNRMIFSYNSGSGLVYLKFGSSKDELLSLVVLNDIGERIVKNYQIFKTKLPGDFDYPGFYDDDLYFCLSIKKTAIRQQNQSIALPVKFYAQLLSNADIRCYPRTNLI